LSQGLARLALTGECGWVLRYAHSEKFVIYDLDDTHLLVQVRARPCPHEGRRLGWLSVSCPHA
jgi:hypothetical protein